MWRLDPRITLRTYTRYKTIGLWHRDGPTYLVKAYCELKEWNHGIDVVIAGFYVVTMPRVAKWMVEDDI